MTTLAIKDGKKLKVKSNQINSVYIRNFNHITMALTHDIL